MAVVGVRSEPSSPQFSLLNSQFTEKILIFDPLFRTSSVILLELQEVIYYSTLFDISLTGKYQGIHIS